MAPALLAPVAPAAAALVAPRPRARGALVASPVGDWRPRSRSAWRPWRVALAWRVGDWCPAPVAPVARGPRGAVVARAAPCARLRRV